MPSKGVVRMKSLRRVRFVVSGLLLAVVVFVAFAAAAGARAADTGTVEGAVYLNGVPLAGVEVWLGDDRYVCTGTDGGFSMQVPANEPLPAATGISVGPTTSCSNPNFLDPATGVPLVVQYWDNVNTGWPFWSPDLIIVTSGAMATIQFDVVPAAAIQNVTVRSHGQAVAEGEAWVRAFNRDDPAFIAAYGRNPNPNQYAEIMEGSIGQLALAWIDEGGTTLRLATVHDLLVLVREGPVLSQSGQISGRLVQASSFRDSNGDGVLEGPPLTINLR